MSKPDVHSASTQVVPSKTPFTAAMDWLVRERERLVSENRELREALERAIPALWLVAASGNKDAAEIHHQARAALERGKE